MGSIFKNLPLVLLNGESSRELLKWECLGKRYLLTQMVSHFALLGWVVLSCLR